MNDLPRPATAELIALAAATRPDWSIDQLRDVLTQARYADMTWGRVLVALAQLIAIPDAEPPDLLAEVPEPWRNRRAAQDADTAHRGAAAARAALHNPPEND